MTNLDIAKARIKDFEKSKKYYIEFLINFGS